MIGYGNGWTVAREWWRGLPKRSRFKEAAAIWCPLDLKERRPGHEAHVPEERRLARGREFANLFGIAFTGRDKPLYKLTQGCSYASVLAAMLPREVLAAGLHVDVVAATAVGIEAVNAPLGAGSQGDAKRQLVEALGNLYRDANKTKRPFEARLVGVYTKSL